MIQGSSLSIPLCYALIDAHFISSICSLYLGACWVARYTPLVQSHPPTEVPLSTHRLSFCALVHMCVCVCVFDTHSDRRLPSTPHLFPSIDLQPIIINLSYLREQRIGLSFELKRQIQHPPYRVDIENTRTQSK